LRWSIIIVPNPAGASDEEVCVYSVDDVADEDEWLLSCANVVMLTVSPMMARTDAIESRAIVCRLDMVVSEGMGSHHFSTAPISLDD
jgi:hypothetical protein